MTILRVRDVRRSMLSWVRTLLQNPPADYGFSNPFTLYNESDMRRVEEKTLIPSRPCIFVTDEYVRPGEIALPLIVAEMMKYTGRPFELGNRKGKIWFLGYHVFGRDRGERDDLSTLIQESLPAAFPIYQFTSSGSTLLESALVGDEVDVEGYVVSKNMQGRQDVRKEGELDLWNLVSFAIETKN